VAAPAALRGLPDGGGPAAVAAARPWDDALEEARREVGLSSSTLAQSATLYGVPSLVLALGAVAARHLSSWVNILAALAGDTTSAALAAVAIHALRAWVAACRTRFDVTAEELAVPRGHPLAGPLGDATARLDALVTAAGAAATVVVRGQVGGFDSDGGGEVSAAVAVSHANALLDDLTAISVGSAAAVRATLAALLPVNPSAADGVADGTDVSALE